MSKKEKARAKLAADPLPASPYLQVHANHILVKCGFSEPMQQLLGRVPKVEWQPELRCWNVPITAAETLRSILPEVLQLAEATQEMEADKTATTAPDAALPTEDLFKAAARLLFGSDWQRETARALGRDETALARFLLGEHTLEDADRLYADMLALMQRRTAEIAVAADRFAAALALRRDAREEPPAADQGM